jgi:Protein of unknown function (DUF1367)
MGRIAENAALLATVVDARTRNFSAARQAEESIMDLLFQKGTAGLIPACEEANEWLRRKKLGATILVEPREMRNGAFHRKYFALLNLAFDYWRDNAETLEYKGQNVFPHFDRFRRDVIILAGFYRPVTNIKGEVRLEAESISFAAMDEERFEKLYSATINVLLERVFNGKICPKWTEQELRSVAQQILEFAA